MQVSKWAALGALALCLVIVATVMHAPHLYYMTAILLTLPGVSYLLGWYMLYHLEFSRQIPKVAWEGEEGDLQYSVRNPTRFARFFLSLHEPLPAWMSSPAQENALFNIGANEEIRVINRVFFHRRGVYRSDGFEVAAMDPLGVFAFTRHYAADGELVVYPLPQSLRQTALTGAERYGWQEFTSRLLRGSSVDPDGVRPYIPGDPMRRIHWRQTARTGKMSVIEFEESQATNLVIALDLKEGTVTGEGTETTLEYGVRLAASLAQEAIQQGASVRLLLPPLPESERQDDPDRQVIFAANSDGRGQPHLFLLLDALARVQATSRVPLHKTVAENAVTVQPGTTLVLITSDREMALCDSFLPYMSIGVKIAIVFIEPASFVAAPSRRDIAQSETFLRGLAALHMPTFVLRSNPNGALNPEEVRYDSALETLKPVDATLSRN